TKRTGSRTCGCRPGPTLGDGGCWCWQPSRWTARHSPGNRSPNRSGCGPGIRFPTSPDCSSGADQFRHRPPARRGRRTRRPPDGQESRETRASLQWLIDRRPDLRNELTYGLVNVLLSGMGDADEATRVLSAAVASADLDALATLTGFASRAGDLSLQKSIL